MPGVQVLIEEMALVVLDHEPCAALVVEASVGAGGEVDGEVLVRVHLQGLDRVGHVGGLATGIRNWKLLVIVIMGV